MRVAVKLNSDNVVIDMVYLQNGNYSNYQELQVIDVDNVDNIIPFKTKYENKQLVELEDYSQEYYSMQQTEEQRRQLQQSIQEIDQWFNEYDMQIKQYERDVRLGNIGIYHIGETTYTIEQLDAEAVLKAAQITQLKNQLNNL